MRRYGRRRRVFTENTPPLKEETPLKEEETPLKEDETPLKEDEIPLKEEITVSERNSFRKLEERVDELKHPYKKYDIIIVGCGISGIVIAEQFATNSNKNILIIDKRNHIAGNCYDYTDYPTGIRMNKYGAHLFHTNDEVVYEYITKYGEWEKWEHKVVGDIDGSYHPIPANIDTVNGICNENIKNEEEMNKWLEDNQIKYDEIKNGEEMAKSRVGEVLYEKIFKHYTYKQWKKYPEELDPEVLARIPVRNSFDDRYFSDKYQVLPKNGYTHFFQGILDKFPQITVKLNTDFEDLRNHISNEQIVIYTGPIDAYFSDKNLPKLEYRSIDFEIDYKFNEEYYQPNSVVNYPGENTKYTRCVEYKHFLNQKSDHTVIVKETTTDKGEPYYPVLNEKNKSLYKIYQELAEKEGENVHFLGRLASYKYFNMDQAIKNSLDYYKEHFEEQIFEEQNFEMKLNQYRKEYDNKIVILFTNIGYIDFALSCYYSMYNNGCKNIIIYCLDEESHNICNSRNIFSKLDILSHSKKFTDYSDHKKFLSINNCKIRFIKELLNYGFDVLYTDSDVYWKINPLSLLSEKQNVEAFFQIDLKGLDYLCAGIMYFKNTTNNRNKLSIPSNWKQIIRTKCQLDFPWKEDRELWCVTENLFDDQEWFNAVYLDSEIFNNLDKININYVEYITKKNIWLLDSKIYINGWTLDNEPKYVRNCKAAHATWRIGYKEKLNIFQKYDLFNYNFYDNHLKLVIARYNEDISWSNIYAGNRVIYNKGSKMDNSILTPGDVYREISNVGRESDTFLNYIIENYENLPSYVCFSQGSLNDHEWIRKDWGPLMFLNMLQEAQNKGYSNCKTYDIQDNIFGLKFNNRSAYNYDKEKNINDKGKINNFRDFIVKIYPEIVNEKKINIFPSAFTVISRDNILKRSKESYKELIQYCNYHINPIEGHYFERSWYYIFNLHLHL